MGSIYKITNTANQKSYIGYTKRGAETRKTEHLRGNGNQPLKNDVEKYGEHAFTFEILEGGIIPDFLPEREKYWIAKFNTFHDGYNLTTGGERAYEVSPETRQKMSYSHKGEKNSRYGTHGWNKGKPLSAEHRKRISEAKKGIPRSKETREKLRIANLGKRYSEETKRKLSEARTGKNNHQYGKPRSEETKRKLSEALKGKPAWNKSSYYEEAHQFFFSLPSDMGLRERRQLLLKEFSDVLHHSTIYKWIKEWQSDP